jgi:hypothetical protein
MMQSAGTAEGLRGLIDTSILQSVKKIIEYRGLFGPSVMPIGMSLAFSPAGFKLNRRAQQSISWLPLSITSQLLWQSFRRPGCRKFSIEQSKLDWNLRLKCGLKP